MIVKFSQNIQNINEIKNENDNIIILGVYIYALWQQDWIKNIFVNRKDSFTMKDNIDYFFDNARTFTTPDYKVNSQV